MSEHSPVILVVDDEPHILSFLTENLATDDFIVHAAPSAAHARSKLGAFRPDLILLDVGLPDATGFDLCREIRDADPLQVRFDPDVPVIMLTARAEEVDRVRGFQRGADDFVPKPFHYPELVARMHALLRRTRIQMGRDVLQVAGINIDLSTREVFVGGTAVTLSAKEFMLLAALARNPRRVFRKQELLERFPEIPALGRRCHHRRAREACRRSEASFRSEGLAGCLRTASLGPSGRDRRLGVDAPGCRCGQGAVATW